MDKALVIIDYTNDFVADDGALTVGKPAQDLDAAIYSLIKQFAKDGQYIAVVNDMHEPGDFEEGSSNREGKLFPPHNLVGTHGRDVYGKTGEILKTVEHEEFDKTLYDALTGLHLNLNGWSESLDEVFCNEEIEEVHLVGVCTDICVLHTAIGLYNFGYKIVIHEDAVASFNQAGHEFAMAHFKNTLGAEIVRAF